MILNALRLSGCGTQHPHRALGGTCVLLAAAPTTPPCFRHWRRSSLLHSGHIQRKYYFYFAILENLRIFQNCLFTSGVVEENGICSACFLRKRSRCEGNVCWSLVNPLRLTAFARFPLLSLRDIFPRSGGSLSSRGELLRICRSALIKLPLRGSWHAVRRD